MIPESQFALPAEVSAFVDGIRRGLGDVQVSTEQGGTVAGNWWIDMRWVASEYFTTVEWRPGLGFGIYSDDSGFGEGPKEVVLAANFAVEKVRELLNTYLAQHSKIAA